MKVKICGIQQLEDALVAAQAGADYIGLVFCPRSRRCIDPPTAQAIVTALKPYRCQVVAVFRDQTLSAVNEITEKTGITLVQLHGQGMHHLSLGNCQRWLAVKGSELPDFDPNLLRPQDTLIIDSDEPGSGQLAKIDEATLASLPVPFFMGGGLNLNNVHAIIQSYHPYGVDVSSGVEDRDGQKCAERIKAFIHYAGALS